MRESSRRTDGSPSPALDLALGVLRHEPAGLLTDLDGTLSPIVDDPAAARLVAGVPEALTALAGRLAVVAAITGRSALDARRMLDGAPVLVVGNHGVEWLEAAASAPERASETDWIVERLDRLLARLPELDGVFVEHKGVSASIHYRGAPDTAAAGAAIDAALGDATPGLERRSGRLSVELRPVGLGDKGSAAEAIVDRFGLRGVLVLGDDVTDLDMFRAVARLRAAGRVRGAIIGVGRGDQEVPPEVSAAADVVVDGVDDAASLLGSLTEALG